MHKNTLKLNGKPSEIKIQNPPKVFLVMSQMTTFVGKLTFTMLNWGVRRSIVATFAAIRLQGPRFKPRPRQKFETRFLLHAHPCSASGATTSGTIEPVPSLETHRKSKQVKG